MHTTIVALVNHKGGTGKTTTSINLAEALAKMGKKIMLIDLDPQGSLTYSLGITPTVTIAEVLAGEVDWDEMLELREGMHIAASSPELANIEIALANYPKREFVLQESLRKLSRYDYIFIDCSPSFSLLTINALCAAHQILVPMQLEVLSLQGLYMIRDTVEQIKKRLNPTLQILGVSRIGNRNRNDRSHSQGRAPQNRALPRFGHGAKSGDYVSSPVADAAPNSQDDIHMLLLSFSARIWVSRS